MTQAPSTRFAPVHAIAPLPFVASTDSTSAGFAHRRNVRAGRAQFGQGSADPVAMKWAALHEAARMVAGIAGIEAPALSGPLRRIPACLREAPAALREDVQQSIEDVCALMEHGLDALAAALARGARPAAAARRLWHEFRQERDAIVAKVPQAPLS